ncbi:hypothetical protein A3E89_02420 [Candidatus Campbellbacteria bacterium RIFCSPHIGHO2_12_FULL_35_10]|uniref:Uncharacterized protein n=1 Tax=Candidatus Campbellbacteria bacterium RIFCSPHIGHO2_12_FULL_35_10 TaxID=1797578 RepID=A0A1F5EQX2_9BACT|nr:MAG: hypothetical protein A3E89_02420 [Candidatus Campbellbacteria bacterium RIFCSPHIGHO2_12_FULL_35_10]
MAAQSKCSKHGPYEVAFDKEAELDRAECVKSGKPEMVKLFHGCPECHREEILRSGNFLKG